MTQRARTITKLVPMYEEACAAKVLQHLEAFLPPMPGPCTCQAVGPNPFGVAEGTWAMLTQEQRTTMLRAWNSQMGLEEPLEEPHQADCASQQPVVSQVPALVEQACGRYSRGQHKGQLRGWAHITLVEEGGWLKNGPGYMNGKVVLPGTILGVAIKDFAGKVLLAMGEPR